jgi:hypothetical protein
MTPKTQVEAVGKSHRDFSVLDANQDICVLHPEIVVLLLSEIVFPLYRLANCF